MGTVYNAFKEKHFTKGGEGRLRLFRNRLIHGFRPAENVSASIIGRLTGLRLERLTKLAWYPDLTPDTDLVDPQDSH